MFRQRAEDRVRAAGYDPARLPPGQYLTERWPVLHVGGAPKADPAQWELRISGAVESPVTLPLAALQELPRSEITVDIHCVTRWSRFDARFAGVHWRDLAPLVGPSPDARFVVAHAEHGYTANLPLSLLEEPGSLVAWEADGEPLTPDHGWPLRLVVASRYFWKSAKWLRGLELRAEDEPGFWERYGYHNEADPLLEQRHAPGEQAATRRAVAGAPARRGATAGTGSA